MSLPRCKFWPCCNVLVKSMFCNTYKLNLEKHPSTFSMPTGPQAKCFIKVPIFATAVTFLYYAYNAEGGKMTHVFLAGAASLQGLLEERGI